MADLPTIGDDDIAWVCDVLGLPPTAFCGEDGSDPRCPILKTLEPIDVEACPGSGKTTLLVAKLAILARHWHARQQGICVLSHTNAARREIERRLGSTAEGQRLLSYPHFVGTIHGFVNEFLALPWLRSKGVSIEAIDDELTLAWRWKKLSYGARSALEKLNSPTPHLKYKNTNFDVGDIPWGPKRTPLRRDTPTYTNIVSVMQKSLEAGLFCHEEMFIWAEDLLTVSPQVASYIRQRFPLLFVDEVQDNSEQQASILNRIFLDGEGTVIRQRYGDANQAIYQFPGQSGAVTDVFPDDALRHDIPNSFRFGQSIADLADPLAIQPQGLRGQGGFGPEPEREPFKAGRHAIFLFEDATAERVLPAYAEYLRSEFSEKELQNGDFTAVGAVHNTDKDDNFPRAVGHYWPDYDPEISGTDPKPNSFVQYLRAGQRLSGASGETGPAVEKLAEAFLRLFQLAGCDVRAGYRQRKHRYVREFLEENPENLARYLRVVETLVIGRAPLTRSAWERDFKNEVGDIAISATNCNPLPQSALNFVAWDENEPDGEQNKPKDNIFRYPLETADLRIRVGSIHSVKGETHTATLVLDTFFRKHHLKTLKQWLLGEKSGGGTENDTTKARLKQHYVAMTRPSRLLCLAMRWDSLNGEEKEQLKERGWRLGIVTAGDTQWKN